MVNHTDSSKIEDRHLLAYLDGEADAETAARIESSPEHLARANELRRMQDRLRAKLLRLDCPESLELGEYQLGYLKRKQAKVIERHLAECPHCRRELEQLRAFLKEEKPQAMQGLLDGVKVLIARLVGQGGEAGVPGGLRLSPAYATLRGGSQGPVTLEADGVLILLDFQPGGEGGVDLLGQVAAGDQGHWTGAAVELRRDGTLVLSTALDDLGAFRGKALEPGLIELSITASGGPVVLANFEIRDE